MQWARIVDPASATLLPPGPGVYRFRDQAGQVLYIGRAISLRRRVLSYWGDLGDRATWPRWWPGSPGSRRWPATPRTRPRGWSGTCSSGGCRRGTAAWAARRPRSGSGSASQPRHPGLTVVRQPAPGDFGPYLGGQKARDAVSGLGRVLPLAHAADGQAGAERDLARLRGASPGDAGRTGPGHRRRAGPGPGRGGRAARGADPPDAPPPRPRWPSSSPGSCRPSSRPWTGSPGSRRSPGPRDDADVYGWADGVLVCFEIRGGRMSGWRQRPCAAAAARRYLDQSPPAWAQFARRNAELAARLRPPQCRTGGSLALAAGRTGGPAQA